MWHELGIEPTADPQAIRRAYARRLKDIDPEGDPEAFHRLRQAYEAALASLARDGHDDSHSTSAPRVASPRADVSRADMRGLPDVAAHPVLDALERAFAEHDARRALALLDEAMAKGLVPMTPDETFIDRLLDVVVADTSLPVDTFARLMRTFGWDAYLDAVSKAPPPSVARAVERLGAAAWFVQLLAVARAPRFGARAKDAAAARVMLGGRRPLLVMDWMRQRLRAELAQFERYEPWLGGRFDPVRIGWLRWATTDEAARREARKLLCFWFLLTALLAAVALLPR
jgi:hypothetical protein